MNASRGYVTSNREPQLSAPIVPLSGPIIWELFPTDHKK